jgi:hypothetical protein
MKTAKLCVCRGEQVGRSEAVFALFRNIKILKIQYTEI